jgi:hypothetical protein
MNEVGVWIAVFIINFVVFLLGYFIGQVHLRYMQMRDEYLQLLIDKKAQTRKDYLHEA